ncbi:MAG: fibrobacter succinogenes major paralogous domain-containing protein [Flavobacteriales bacterium]
MNAWTRHAITRKHERYSTLREESISAGSTCKVDFTWGAQAAYGEGTSACLHGNCDEVQNLEDYSRLYNWYAVDDSRGLCPSGWHVPTDGEWMTLEMELGMSESEANSIGYRGTDQGTQMKSSSSDTPSWNGSNTSGFSALPGGLRSSSNGYFFNEGSFGCWWSASPYVTSYAWSRTLRSVNDNVYRLYGNLRNGFSVRCVRDE